MIILFEINQNMSSHTKQDLSGSFEVSCRKYHANITQELSACMLSVCINNTRDMHISRVGRLLLSLFKLLR